MEQSDGCTHAHTRAHTLWFLDEIMHSVLKIYVHYSNKQYRKIKAKDYFCCSALFFLFLFFFLQRLSKDCIRSFNIFHPLWSSVPSQNITKYSEKRLGSSLVNHATDVLSDNILWVFRIKILQKLIWLVLLQSHSIVFPL